MTLGDVQRSSKICGPPTPPLKGRTRFQISSRVPDFDLVQLPPALHEDLKNITLCIDFHFVNGITVLHSISRRLECRTVTFPLIRSVNSIAEQLDIIFNKQNARGFRITDVHADKEFEKTRHLVPPVRLHICGVYDYVPEVERSVQTQKNENRSVCRGLPYKCLSRVMVRELITQGNTFLNAFGNDDLLTDGLTPRNVIDNLPHVDFNDLKHEFGQHAQLHIAEKVTNAILSRTIGAIVLGPRDARGQCNFMSLETGSKIDGRVITILPLASEVI